MQIEDDPRFKRLLAYVQAMAKYPETRADEISIETARRLAQIALHDCASYEREAEHKADTRRECTCLGACRGAARLALQWRCVMEKPAADGE